MTALALVAALLLAAPLAAQGVRITGTTTARYIDVRPMVTDSVPVGETTPAGEGSLRESSRGIVVRCVPGEPFCRYKRSAEDPVSTVPLVQDLEMSAWGLGTGVQVYAHVRGRAAMGSERELWPRADDHFDALAAYVEVDRERFRARAGRQWKTSGLGFYNFDGASLLVRPHRDITVDVYGGWSLVRGLNAPVTNAALGAVDELPPDERAYLLGVQLSGRPTSASAVSVLYQREIRTDRAGLYSERVAADGELRIGRFGMAHAAVEADLATGDLNHSRLRAQVPVARRLALLGEARYYRPFFELWTIWGAFTPIGFAEGTVGALWGGVSDRLSLQVRGGWRRYEDTDAGVGFLALRRDGWRVTADGSWRATPEWVAHAGYRTDVGFGAARTDGDVGVRWEPAGRRVFAGARATLFQTVQELRLASGRVVGFGVDGGVRLRADARLVGDLALYRHSYDEPAPTTDWSQRRASLRLEWTIGRDPGEPPGLRGMP